MFNPTFTPYQMLALGVFDGGYFNDDDSCIRIDGGLPVIRKQNLFAENVSQTREAWINNGWITSEDPLGWFQWYTRYFNGRRIESLDSWQIGRWKSFVARHSAQVRKNGNGDMTKRLRQRQALLHWGADPIPDVDVEDKFSFLKEKYLLTF
jgi:hypothetical protein